jgi:predicted RNase H-like HicB family nuclease
LKSCGYRRKGDDERAHFQGPPGHVSGHGQCVRPRCPQGVPQIPACHTQARSLNEVTERIREAIALCLEVEGPLEQELEFVGIQRVTIAA